MAKSNPTLTKKLRENRKKKIPFAVTRQELIDEGFSSIEISHALFEEPYDKKPKKKPHPASIHFEDNPEETRKVAEAILREARNKKMTNTALHGIASRTAFGFPAQMRHSIKFYDDLGIPFFKIFFASIGLLIAVGFYDWPEILISIFFGVIGVWILVKFLLYK